MASWKLRVSASRKSASRPLMAGCSSHHAEAADAHPDRAAAARRALRGRAPARGARAGHEPRVVAGLLPRRRGQPAGPLVRGAGRVRLRPAAGRVAPWRAEVSVNEREQDQETLRRAAQLQAPLLKVARSAGSNCLGYVVFAVLTALLSLSTQAADLASMGVAAVLLFVGL